MVDDSGNSRNASVAGSTDRHGDSRVPGLTVQRQPLDFFMQAQLIGTLDIDPSVNCLIVRQGNTIVDVAWPIGWSVALRDDEITLIDAAGQTVRRFGDEVRAEGGSVDADRANVVSCTGAKQVFLASNTPEREWEGSSIQVRSVDSRSGGRK